MAYFKHPEHHASGPQGGAGVVTFEDQTFPVRAGVVNCPASVGNGADWRPATVDEIAAHEAAADTVDESTSDGPSDDDATTPRKRKR